MFAFACLVCLDLGLFYDFPNAFYAAVANFNLVNGLLLINIFYIWLFLNCLSIRLRNMFCFYVFVV